MDFVEDLKKYIASERFYNASGKFVLILAFLFLLSFSFALYLSFVAPADYQQGDAFRIFYVHVPCAVFSLAIYTFMAVNSFIYLVFRVRLNAILSISSAPLGAIFTLLALITGSLWGKPMWGTYWVWDARLTSELILFFLYVGYIAFYSAVDNKNQAFKLSSILCIVGFINVPIVHYSVNWWYTLHQGATLLKFGKPQITMQMLQPALFMFLAFVCYSAAAILILTRINLLSVLYSQAWVKKAVKKHKISNHDLY